MAKKDTQLKQKTVKWKKPKDTPEKITPKKVITVIALLRRTWLEISTFWRPLLGITAVYAVLYFIFVMGLNMSGNIQFEIDDSGSRIAQATTSIIGAFSSTYSGSQSDATTLIQMLLFVITSLAFIWALRKLQALKAITIRDSFYQGSAQIIPVLLVVAVLVFTLLPAVLGSSILAIVLQAGGGQLEVVIVSAISFTLLFISAFLFTMYWPAYYIASLPQTRPLQALRSALAVTKKRRFAILRKLVFLGFMIVIVMMVFLLPFALLLPALVQYALYGALFVIFMYSQVYLYELYRSLL